MFLEIKVDNEIFGKVIIELFGDVTIGAQRFLELSKGLEGVQYRSSKFEEINAGSYIVNGGLRNLTYSAGGETKVTGGDSASEQLVPEFEKKLHKHDSAGIVSLYVFDNEEREVRIVCTRFDGQRLRTKQRSPPTPPFTHTHTHAHTLCNMQIKERLIARDGKLVTIQEDTVPAPNGTSFTITLKPLPELDETNLPVGRVVSGLDIVERVSKLKAVADNSDSPYFKVAKAIGDKRAITAERGFSRPFARVVVSKCGIVN